MFCWWNNESTSCLWQQSSWRMTNRLWSESQCTWDDEKNHNRTSTLYLEDKHHWWSRNCGRKYQEVFQMFFCEQLNELLSILPKNAEILSAFDFIIILCKCALQTSFNILYGVQWSSTSTNDLEIRCYVCILSSDQKWI